MKKVKPRDPNLTWSMNLPDKLKCAIADCITLHSKIESCIVELVWLLEDADLERKKQIAAAWGDKNLDYVKRIVKEMMAGAKTDAIWPAMKELRNDRNLIGHGVWMMGSDDNPYVAWHAKMLESEDYTTAEVFSWKRFDFFLERGSLMLKTFSQFKDLLEDGLAKEKAKNP